MNISQFFDDDLSKMWATTEAASDRVPVPKGRYTCLLLTAQPNESRTGTRSIELVFELCEGEHSGRRIWHSLWLTPAAISYSKRDLGKFGITQLEQLNNPIPRQMCDIDVVIHADDGGREYNRVRNISNVRPEPADPLTPTPEADDV